MTLHARGRRAVLARIMPANQPELFNQLTLSLYRLSFSRAPEADAVRCRSGAGTMEVGLARNVVSLADMSE